jgi:hypothetical protein
MVPLFLILGYPDASSAAKDLNGAVECIRKRKERAKKNADKLEKKSKVVEVKRSHSTDGNEHIQNHVPMKDKSNNNGRKRKLPMASNGIFI